MFCLFQYSKGSWPLPTFAVLVMELWYGWCVPGMRSIA